MRILVTGGAGYIGSITSKHLIEKGHDVVVYDSLIKGYKENIDPKASFVQGCLSNKELLSKTFKNFNPQAVIHFANFIEAGESMKYPSKFFENNITNGLSLLKVMVKNKLEKIIYSSSAGIYTAKDEPLKEDDTKEPASVYGETKLIFERILKWYDKVHGIKSISLRYFNAFGNDVGLGERHNPETHLIPRVIFAALGKRKSISIFGTDYDTPDGTCIRDYVHVKDLAVAHLLALENLDKEVKSKTYNVGTGEGISVREVINKVKEVTGRDFKIIEEKRRAGDPAFLVADSNKIKEELRWYPIISFKKGLEETAEYFKRNVYS